MVFRCLSWLRARLYSDDDEDNCQKGGNTTAVVPGGGHVRKGSTSSLLTPAAGLVGGRASDAHGSHSNKATGGVPMMLKPPLGPVDVEEAKRWFVVRRRNPHARVRLLCLPWAGGSSSIYRNWDFHEAEVVAVELPGRMGRYKEPPLPDLHIIIDRLIQAMEMCGYLTRHAPPLVLLGHSFGSMLTINLARALRRKPHLAQPKYLVVSGCSPLDVRESNSRVSTMTDDEIIDYLVAMGGVPVEVATNREWMEVFLPAIRGDYTAIDNYVHVDEPPLSYPLLALGGDSDDKAPAHTMNGWSRYTSSTFTLRMFTGGHFFIKDLPQDVMAIVESVALRNASRGM